MAYFTSVYFVGITGNSNWFSELRSRKRPSIFRLGKEGRERESFDMNNSYNPKGHIRRDENKIY